MFTTFLIFDVIIALGYYFVSPCFFWYVKNGTRAEAVKCSWFLFAGFVFFNLNLMVILNSMIALGSKITGNSVQDFIILTKCIIHPLIMFVFGIWLGERGLKIFPSLLIRFKEEKV